MTVTTRATFKSPGFGITDAEYTDWLYEAAAEAQHAERTGEPTGVQGGTTPESIDAWMRTHVFGKALSA